MEYSQAEIEQLNQFERYVSFKKTWAYKRFIHMPNWIIFLCTGNQCLAAESMIYDPVKKCSTRIDEIKEDFHVQAWDGEKLVTAKAERPYKRSVSSLYRIGLSNGQSFVASSGHRILLSQGYVPLKECVVGSSVFRPLTISGTSLLKKQTDVRRLTQTVQDFQSDYQGCRHLYDGQPLSQLDIDQSVSPLQDGVQEHTALDPYKGDSVCIDADSRRLSSRHLSNQDADLHHEDRAFDSLFRFFYKGRLRISDLFQAHPRLPNALIHLPRRACVFFQSAIETLFRFLCNTLTQLELSPQVYGQSTASPFSLLLPISEPSQLANKSFSYKPPLNSLPLLVTSISYLRNDVKWDFGVPFYENYYHAGIIHHNCGKSGGAARQYVDRILGYHPIPKKNLMYFECKKRADMMEQALEDDIKYEPVHGYHQQNLKLPDDTIINVQGHEKGTWSMGDKPKDDKCPYCGEDIIVHQRRSKKFRFCSQTLPGEKETIEGSDGESADVKNVVYPEFKKWLPSFLIKKDITFRSYAMIIKDPYAGQVLLRDEIYKGSDAVVEFVSYSQTIQSTAGAQRCSIWIDEECPKDFWDEQIPRLMAEDGDLLLTLTPANRLSWSFDELFERASIYYRTKKICEALSTERDPLKMGEVTDFDKDIGVLQASSYDNPTLSDSVIEKMLESIDDPDVRMTRLYGVHKQASGRVFKDFDYRTHLIDPDKYFPEGMYSSWRFARLIDYHEKNPWACIWIALSPHNEAFVYQEMSPSPEKMVTLEVSHRLAELSEGYKFFINLIDPLAEKKQSNTATSVREDINNHFMEFKREDIYPGFKGGFFESWDTKSTRGRDEIRKRLKWARQVGVPFNNKITDDGNEKYVPTLWVLNNCKETAKSLKQWRYEEYGERNSVVNKDSNEKVTQKFSHFPMCLEAIFKDLRFKPPPRNFYGTENRTPRYFQGRKRRVA